MTDSGDDLQYEGCTCYTCIGSVVEYTDDGRPRVMNNMQHHTLGQPCSDCGRPKGKYRDLGRKGRYICWYCRGPGNGDEVREHNPPEIPDYSTIWPPIPDAENQEWTTTHD